MSDFDYAMDQFCERIDQCDTVQQIYWVWRDAMTYIWSWLRS